MNDPGDVDRITIYHLRRAIRAMRRRRKTGEMGSLGVDVRIALEECCDNLSYAFDPRLRHAGALKFLVEAERQLAIALDGMRRRVK